MIFWRVHKILTTSSTNDDAKRAAADGEPEGLVIWSLKQSSGRGRHGRTWDSPEGNLYCSVLLRPSDLASIGQYSFVAALALRDTVKTFLPASCIGLKWPNDILVDGKKISGILLETVEQGLIVGMGLNVNYKPDNALYPTASLVSAGADRIDLEVILNTLLNALKYWYSTIQTDGFLPIRSAWLQNAITGPMIVRLPHSTIEGHFADLDADGNLRLNLADGTEKAIASGDVFIPTKD